MIIKTVHRLRERPHHERRAVAAGVALSTTGLLLVGWFAFFIHNNVGTSDVQAQATPVDTNVAAVQVSQQTQVAAPQPALQNIPAGGYLTGDSTTSINDYLNSSEPSAAQ